MWLGMLVLSSSTFVKTLGNISYYITFFLSFSRTLLQGVLSSLSASAVCSALPDYCYQHKSMLPFSLSVNSIKKPNAFDCDYPLAIIAFLSFASWKIPWKEILLLSDFSLQICLLLNPLDQSVQSSPITLSSVLGFPEYSAVFSSQCAQTIK